MERFPADFMFQLTADEYAHLMSQIAISSGHGGRRKLPYAFTEYGAVMAASVLNSPKAVEVSVYVTRAFIQQRELLAAHADLALKLERLERKLLASFALTDSRLDDHENQLEQIIEAIREMRNPTPRRPIGYRTSKEGE